MFLQRAPFVNACTLSDLSYGFVVCSWLPFGISRYSSQLMQPKTFAERSCKS